MDIEKELEEYNNEIKKDLLQLEQEKNKFAKLVSERWGDRIKSYETYKHKKVSFFYKLKYKLIKFLHYI